jgi:hypothetical protein
MKSLKTELRAKTFDRHRGATCAFERVGRSLRATGLVPTRKWTSGLSCGCLLAICALLMLPVVASAARVIEAGAIPFTAFLSKADFDQRYPGKEVTDLSKLEPGWYVIYEHASLSYYFGPVLLESTGQDYLDQLTETVEAAVDQRPSIQDYRLELSYEPSQSSTPSGSAETDSGAANPGGSAGTPQPTPRPSIWDFFRRLFGL